MGTVEIEGILGAEQRGILNVWILEGVSGEGEINCWLSHEALVFDFLEAAKQRWDLQRRSPAVCFPRRVLRAGGGWGRSAEKGAARD